MCTLSLSLSASDRCILLFCLPLFFLSSPLKSAPWVKEWKENSIDSVFKMFIGGDLLPPGDPFRDMNHYADVDKAVQV